jgi:hypothetical protein
VDIETSAKQRQSSPKATDTTTDNCSGFIFVATADIHFKIDY